MTWKIKVKDIISKKRIKIEDYYFTEYVELHTGTYKVIDGKFKVKISITYTDDTIIVGGLVKGSVERPCDRCLEIAAMPLEGTIEAIYDLKNEPNFKNSEIENLKNVIYYKGDEIDLEERIIEALVVSAPDVFVCKEDCKGLCPYCGTNLNVNPDHKCDKIEDVFIDPRLEKLLELKKKLENN